VRAAIALALLVPACAVERAGPSRQDCEAVLAHLVVLESATIPVMCRFHAGCGGDEEDLFLQRCPAVLSRRELGCYQRATSIDAADACLARDALAARIDTGVVEARDHGDDAEGWHDDAWAWNRSPEEQALAGLRDLRDDACRCHDRACAERVEQRFMTLVEHWESRHGKPSESLEREGERIYSLYSDCLEAARASDPLPPPY